MKIETWYAAGGTDPGLDPHLIPRYEHYRPMKSVGQSAGHDPDHAWMPSPLGQYQGRLRIEIELFLGLLGGGKLDAPLQCLPGGIELIYVLRQFQGAIGPIGHEQLHGQLRLTQSTGRVQPRRQAKGQIVAIQGFLFVDLGDFH
jgi:hypothetical protein